MGAAKPLLKEITNYLEYLNMDQQKAVLSVVKNFVTYEEKAWEDEGQFNAEMKNALLTWKPVKTKELLLMN